MIRMPLRYNEATGQGTTKGTKVKNIEITREQFNKDLYAFASKWVASLQDKIIEQADELFENPATRYMLHAYAEAKSNRESVQMEVFFYRLTFGEDVDEYVMHSIEDNTKKMQKYGETLYEIIFE